MASRSLVVRWVVVAFMAMLATLALATVTAAQPAEAAPRVATALAVAQDDDDGGGDDDDGARRGAGSSASRADDDDGARSGAGSSASRADDDDGARSGAKGGVRDVPAGGVDTGVGGTASDGMPSGPGVPYLLAGGALLVGAVTALLRRVTGSVDS